MTSYEYPNPTVEFHLGKRVKDESREPISRDGMLLSAAAPLGEFYIFFAQHQNISL